MSSSTAVSLVATVLNEAPTLASWLDSIDAQTYRPDEVVIVDGGSTDGTLEHLHAWANERADVHILAAAGSTISRGRNLAIRQASGDLVAVTDAGVRLAPDWLERLLAAFDPEVDVVSGFFVPDPKGLFEFTVGATVLPSAGEVDGARFLPSSRSVAFRRSAWERAGGYPEWLDYCEDLVFDFALRAHGAHFAWEPRALVHFRPRGTLRDLFIQYFRYARGDGKADLWRHRHALRYAAYAFALFALGRQSPLAILALAAGAGFYCRRPAERLFTAGPRNWEQTLLALGLIPLIRLTGDLAKMIGYPMGLWWRWQHRNSFHERPPHAD